MSSALKLMSHGDEVTTVNVDAVVGNSLLKKLGEDARYVSAKQFRIFRDASSGRWNIDHELSAQNETLLNGDKLIAPVELKDGDEISVGNSSKGIQKMPLTVRMASEVTTIPTVSPAPPPAEAPSSSATGSPTLPVAGSPPADKSGPAFLNGLKAVGGALLPIAGGILGALLAGATSSDAALVRIGRSTFGDVILNIKDGKVRKGRSAFGDVLMTIEGEKIHRGNSAMFGEVLAHVDGDRVIAGNSMFGDVIAKIDGNHVIEGTSMFGNVLANVEHGGRMSVAAAAVYLLLM